MTSQQKAFLLALVAVNVLLFCLCAPLAAFLMTRTPESPQPTLAALQTTPTRAAPTATPAPTYTRVIGPANPPPQPATPPAGIETGWNYYTKPGDGFGIAIPPTWQQQELDSASWESIIQSLEQSNPQLAAVLKGQGAQLLATGVKFFAFDAAPDALAENLVTNLNIIRSSSPLEISLDTFVEVSLKQAEGIAGISKPIAHRRVKLTSGDAEQINYALTMKSAAGETISIATLQYLIVRGKERYVITFSTPQKYQDKYAPIFEKIANSLRWTNQ